jgi:hypothetical protein
MPATVTVKSSDDAVRKHREELAHRVIAQFGDSLPDSPLLCYLDDEDWPAFRGPGMAANRGVRRDAFAHGLLSYVPPSLNCSQFEAFIYLHGSTCSSDLALAMTLAHELEHYVQHAKMKNLWAANTVAFLALRHMERAEFEGLGLRTCDIPHEREARIIAKQIGEKLFGADAVGKHIETKITERLTEQDASDWDCIRGLVASAPFDLATETERFFPKLKRCSSALHRVLRDVQRNDPDFEGVHLDELLEGPD